jgi:hypothetical protein
MSNLAFNTIASLLWPTVHMGWSGVWWRGMVAVMSDWSQQAVRVWTYFGRAAES